jgi:DNA-binding NtrC family response regulator
MLALLLANTMAHILVVDDEHGIRDLLFEILNDEGHTVELAENAAQAQAARHRARPDMVLLDIWMPDKDGVSLLKEWGSTGLLTMPVVMMSGHATIETAVEATKLGALSFLEKPITLQKLMQSVETALKKNATGAVPRSIPVSAIAAQAPESHAQTSAANAATVPSYASPFGPLPEVRLRLEQPLREAKEQFELAYFSYHLQVEHGSVAKVAEKTGLERTHLYRKLKQLGIDTSRGHGSMA